MKRCKMCNKEYESLYINQNGSKYKQETEFCSKSCATTYQRGSITKEMIEDEIVNFVIDKNIYCSGEQIQKGIKRSSKTLVKFGISIVDIQKTLGFVKDKSMFQEKVYTELKKYFTDIACEATFDGLVSPKGFCLRIDFYIKSKNLFIEADGTQHTDIKNPWYSEYYSSCDNIKNVFAKKNKYNIVRIPYKRNIQSDYISKHIEAYIHSPQCYNVTGNGKRECLKNLKDLAISSEAV